MATYHVSKHGSASDSNGGTNATTDAWATITASVAKLSPGDILEVHVGTYVESVTPGGFGGISWVSGSSGSGITIRAYNDTATTTKGVSAGTDAVVIKPNSGNCIGFNKNDAKYITIAGFVLDGTNSSDSRGISLNNDANNLIFRNCEIKNVAEDGIETSIGNGSATTDRNNLFQYLYIHNTGTLHSGNAKHGIYTRQRGNIFEHLDIAESDSGSIQVYYGIASVHARNPHNNIIRYCILRENMTEYHFQQGGLFVGPYCTNLKFHNNLVYRHRDCGLDFSSTGGSSTGHKIYNNTLCDIGNGVTGNGEQGIRVTTNAYSLEIKNNLIYDVAGTPIEDTYSVATTSNNFLDTENPNFNGYTQGSAWDLSLTGSTPNEINNGGVDLGSEYYEDFAGDVRSGTISIGAYKTASPPSPPLDPVLGYPSSITTTPNTNAVFDLVFVQDNNDPDVGNYDIKMVLYGSGVLNDGV